MIYSKLLFIFQAFSQKSYGFGVMVVEVPNQSELLMCIKYYPLLSNLTSDRSQAVIFQLDNLADLENADTCDTDDEHIPKDLKGQMALIPTSVNVTTNCTIGERAQIIQVRSKH